MRSAAYGAFSEETVLDALTGRRGTRRWAFRYERLSAANVKLADLDNVIACTVEQDWLADIKRKATFEILDDGTIDYLSERIKPYARLQLPPYGPGDYAEWPMGVFLLSTPSRSIDATDKVTRTVQGFDPLQALADDKPPTRYSLSVGTVVTTAVSDLLGSIPKSIAASTKTLPADKEWDPGTSKLSIINNLLGTINYNSLSFDEDGVALVAPYTSPVERAPGYTYAVDDRSLLYPQVTQDLDVFSVPNQWTLVVSNPDQAPLVATVTNSDPASITSTVRRGRTITDHRVEEEATDLDALTARVQRLAFESSQVFETVTFTTGLNPLHSGNDIVQLDYPALAISAQYAEQSWRVELKAGAAMDHKLRRVVNVNLETV